MRTDGREGESSQCMKPVLPSLSSAENDFKATTPSCLEPGKAAGGEIDATNYLR